MSYSTHLSKASDLVTLQEDTRAGFVAMAVERSVRAVPYVGEARALKVSASAAQHPAELLTLATIRAGMVSASGVSDKAKGHMEEADKIKAIEELITNHLETAGNAFIEELVFRYLLTKGDSLGGSMRNVTGSLAGRKLTRSILSALSLAGLPYAWRHRTNGTWISGIDGDSGIEAEIRSLSWTNGSGNRVLVFNCNVPTVGKNVDLCLLSSGPELCDEAVKNSGAYIALGELKGGIDPAGADEHWKTATTALDRIRIGFSGAINKPATFFIGAAIVPTMAEEIWNQLESGLLTNAANLTNPDQLASISSWLVQM